MFYQTQYTDPTTGDVNMQARWYSPTSGTFRSRDTYAGNLNTPVSLNRYTYAGNNPIRYWDPNGHEYELACSCYVFYGYDESSGDAAGTSGTKRFFDDGTTEYTYGQVSDTGNRIAKISTVGPDETYWSFKPAPAPPDETSVAPASRVSDHTASQWVLEGDEYVDRAIWRTGEAAPVDDFRLPPTPAFLSPSLTGLSPSGTIDLAPGVVLDSQVRAKEFADWILDRIDRGYQVTGDTERARHLLQDPALIELLSDSQRSLISSTAWGRAAKFAGPASAAVDLWTFGSDIDRALQRSEGQGFWNQALAVADEGTRSGLGIAGSFVGGGFGGSLCAGTVVGAPLVIGCGFVGAYTGQTIAHGTYDFLGWGVENTLGRLWD